MYIQVPVKYCLCVCFVFHLRLYDYQPLGEKKYPLDTDLSQNIAVKQNLENAELKILM